MIPQNCYKLNTDDFCTSLFHDKYLKIISTFLFNIIFVFVFIVQTLHAQLKEENVSYIVNEKSPGSFSLSSSGKSTPLYISSKDYPGVIRALKDLQNDIKSVTNSEPRLSFDILAKSNEVIIVGTIGNSPLIDKLVSEKKLDVAGIAGKWETFIIQVIEKPAPGIDMALVIAGSDKRGTIYGIYDLAEKIGVSPWYWWADVPVKKQDALFVLPGRHSLGQPAVKYRGIFLNDEFPALGGFAFEKYGGFNHKFYVKVFELLLRLKANYLWPAMWNNNFNDEDSLNPPLADEYGIVMGTSHHEPMSRAWKEWPKYGHGAWSYQTNDSTLRDYWQKGIKRIKNYETLITLGMRGDGDEEMSANANIGLLEKIITDQRKIIADVTKKDVTSIPQVWALYKEVQDYYDKGLKAPDDVTLLFADDNWGNLRKLPKLDAKPRKGGYGIYYHFDYVGGPRNYKWLNTVQIERVWEQMHLAYSYGANQIWIVNVGDLKPLEFPISFFLDYAWSPGKWPAQKLPEYYKQWVGNQFGREYAVEVADILEKYTKYNSRIKPELLSPETYSLINFREAETIAADYSQLAEKTEKIYNSIPNEYKDAFFQLVKHPVSACANLNDLYITTAKNRLYAQQGRAATNNLAGKVIELFKKDADISFYYNKVMANGKWNHIMDQTHIGYTYWQQPDSNAIPALKEITLPEISEMGIAVEGSVKWFPKDTLGLALPVFDKYNRQSYFIEIFNRGNLQFGYSIKPEASWIKIDSPSGKIDKQNRIWISVDWEKAPAGLNKIPIKISDNRNVSVEVLAIIENPSAPARNEIIGFVESNEYVSIEAEHFSKAIGSALVSWEKIPNLGRTSSAVTAMPVTVSVQEVAENTPHLEYNVYLFSRGEIKVNAYFSPTLKFKGTDLHYAISIDDEKPQIINITPSAYPADLNKDGLWNKWVSDNINIRISNHMIQNPGLHVLKFWLVDPGVVLQKIILNTGELKKSYLGAPESFSKLPL